ncbi:parathyroid hormone 4 [Hippocampus zosterae]|uniref:parathyroid hormone 4 n=1 Tax=Hippocampus zosterae TaxID=109293 RepID=UPI00223D15FA|nr:parathyroid hormone 4 [Hippocampus zosterae]
MASDVQLRSLRCWTRHFCRRETHPARGARSSRRLFTLASLAAGITERQAFPTFITHSNSYPGISHIPSTLLLYRFKHTIDKSPFSNIRSDDASVYVREHVFARVRVCLCVCVCVCVCVFVFELLYKRSGGRDVCIFHQRGGCHHHKMQMCHTPMRQLAFFMLLVVFPAGLCEQNQSRRAVAEHQLMHDRGRNIQSLKRLIWLSGAMEGLHTAQTRSLAPAAPVPRKASDAEVNPDVASLVHNFLSNFFNNPYGTRVAQREA